MNVDQYIEIYHRTGVDGLNDAVATLEGGHRADVLKSLQAKGFEILQHGGREGGPAGMVLRGPDEKFGLTR